MRPFLPESKTFFPSLSAATSDIDIADIYTGALLRDSHIPPLLL